MPSSPRVSKTCRTCATGATCRSATVFNTPAVKNAQGQTDQKLINSPTQLHRAHSLTHSITLSVSLLCFARGMGRKQSSRPARCAAPSIIWSGWARTVQWVLLLFRSRVVAGSPFSNNKQGSHNLGSPVHLYSRSGSRRFQRASLSLSLSFSFARAMVSLSLSLSLSSRLVGLEVWI